MDDSTPSRRQFLTLAGAGTGVAVAGCSGLLDGESDGATDGEASPADGTATGEGGDDRRATLVVQPDQEALQEEQVRISQEVEEEGLSQQEAQEQFMEAQQEALASAVGEVESAVAEGEVTIEDAVEQQGALLVAGPATGLIDLLPHEAVGALIDAETFQQAQQAGQTEQAG